MTDPKADGMEPRSLTTVCELSTESRKSHHQTTRQDTAPLRQLLSRLGAVLSLALISCPFLGCSDTQPVTQSDAEMTVGVPVGGTDDTGDFSDIELPDSSQPHAPLSVQAANARLAGRERRELTNAQFRWGLDQTQSDIVPPFTSLTPGSTTLVQVSETDLPPVPDGEADEPEDSLSDAPGPPELIPTPRGQREIQAEEIPTPLGVPDVADADSKPDPIKPDPTKPDSPEQLMARVPDKKTDDANPADPVKATQVVLKPATSTPDGSSIDGPEDYTTWAKPDVTIVVTGQQHGYIEPCGCTGLEKQKGGVARRYTFFEMLKEKGWDLLPIDGGNQIRRMGQQASIKLSWSTEALKKMNYQAVGFGPDDMRLAGIDLLQIAAASGDDSTYVSANVVLFGDASYVPNHKVVERGKQRIGMTTVLDPKALTAPLSDIEVKPLVESAKQALVNMDAKKATFKIISFFGDDKAAEELMRAVPGYDMVIVAGGFGEPTYKPQAIEGSETQLIVTGNKAMYAGLVGLYKDQPLKYARVPLTHEFKDAPKMRTLMAEYQEQLKALGLGGLGLTPIPHPTGEKFVGTATCGQCHTKALDVWKFSPHADATDSIVSPPEDRGDVPRHFDPECLSCHVTGWNPQNYYPYESGYVDLEASKHLHGNGCENCHGPGASHAAAEREDSKVSQERKLKLRESMRLPYEKAKEQCMKCHDLDNSPDFHEPDAFEDDYWPQIEHSGMD